MVIVGRGLLDFGEVFTTLAEQPNKIGLEINEKWKKFMAVSWQPYNEYEHVQLDTYNFEIVKVKIAKLIKMNQDQILKKNYKCK